MDQLFESEIQNALYVDDTSDLPHFYSKFDSVLENTVNTIQNNEEEKHENHDSIYIDDEEDPSKIDIRPYFEETESFVNNRCESAEHSEIDTEAFVKHTLVNLNCYIDSEISKHDFKLNPIHFYVSLFDKCLTDMINVLKKVNYIITPNKSKEVEYLREFIDDQYCVTQRHNNAKEIAQTFMRQLKNIDTLNINNLTCDYIRNEEVEEKINNMMKNMLAEIAINKK